MHTAPPVFAPQSGHGMTAAAAVRSTGSDEEEAAEELESLSLSLPAPSSLAAAACSASGDCGIDEHASSASARARPRTSQERLLQTRCREASFCARLLCRHGRALQLRVRQGRNLRRAVTKL